MQPKGNPSYFLVSVSTRENLELCIKHGLAGFPSGQSGAWTYCEIENGDLISFLYGARAHNLYRVASREAIKDADRLPPWRPLTFSESGKTYSFPFRLNLDPVREFVEPLVRTEFAYVAENLLLRGGYRKTHFQADQTTLQSVSQLGQPQSRVAEKLLLPVHDTFEPAFTRKADQVKAPTVCKFQELILQTAIRRVLSDAAILDGFLRQLQLSAIGSSGQLEILGEKALTQGHVDLLVKQRVPLGSSLRIPIEVKTNKAQPDDISQVTHYVDELGECVAGVLIASDFKKETIRQAANTGVKLARYELDVDMKIPQTFESIRAGLSLHPIT